MLNEHDLSIVIIESEHRSKARFGSALSKKGFEVHAAGSGSEGFALIQSLSPDAVVVNAASLRTNGLRIVKWIRASQADLPIVLIVDKDVEPTLAELVNVVLLLPFTVQKLSNRLRLFDDVKYHAIMRCGKLFLNLEKFIVKYGDKEARLTRRCTALMRVFMEHPGEVLTREELFKEIWETEYTEDTRTLDVHISWLRAAIEENPRQPKLIQTVRGVGYILRV